MAAVEALLRKASKRPKGRMQIKRRHVDKLLGSNARSQEIGKPRADIVWGCVAELISSGQHTNADMVLKASHLELLRARGIAAQREEARGRSHRIELRGSIVAWLEENEERVAGQPFLLRPGKLNQLKAARQKTLSTRGRGPALMATLALLALAQVISSSAGLWHAGRQSFLLTAELLIAQLLAGAVKCIINPPIRVVRAFFCFLDSPQVNTPCCRFRERHTHSCARLSEYCCGLVVPVGESEKILSQLKAYTRALALETGSKVTWAAGSLTTSVFDEGRPSTIRTS